MVFVFFFKQKTAYEMRISDWSSDVCSSDLIDADGAIAGTVENISTAVNGHTASIQSFGESIDGLSVRYGWKLNAGGKAIGWVANNDGTEGGLDFRSEEHTSELQSLMRISYAVFCLKKKKQQDTNDNKTHKKT